VLSAAMEQITGTRFLDYMQKEIFTPLKMKNTSGDYKNKEMRHRAEFYNYDEKEKKFMKAPEVNNSNKWAGGGFISTPADLVKFGNAVLHHTILDSATSALVFEPQKLNNGKVNDVRYALGWKNDSTTLFTNAVKVQQLHHGGSASGSTSMLVLFPAYNLSVSILVNRGGFASADLFKYAHKIAEMFLTKGGTILKP
jgi:CubicO group peptidase (beta-lactamase class C family)